MSLTKTRDSCWRQWQEKFQRVDSGYNSKPDEIEIEAWEYARLVNCYVVGGVETKYVQEENVSHRYMILYFYAYVVGVAVDEMRLHDSTGCGCNLVRFLKIGTDLQWREFAGGFAAQFAGDNS